jgi:hypothetical protein
MTTYEAGDYSNYGGVRRTCWLDEGAITVSTGRGLGGGTVPSVSGASEISLDMLVVVSTDTGNTWANAGPSPVVTRISNGNDLIIGVVVSEPEEMERKPATQTIATAANTIALRLTSKFLRSATVWFPNVTAMTKARLLCANGGNVTPGTKEILKIDVSESILGNGITVNDVASGGSANMCSMHYQAQSTTADVYIMLAFLGGTNLGAT